VATHSPLRTSHNLTVSSKEPETRRLPWGEKATEKQKLEWPLNSTRVSPWSVWELELYWVEEEVVGEFSR